MVTPREVTWRERKELALLLERHGITAQKLADKEVTEFPFEFAEMILVYGYDDFRTEAGKPNEEALNELSVLQMAQYSTDAYVRIFFKPEIEKKS